MFEYWALKLFENPPTRTHANRNYVVAMMTQVIVAAGACAMGGCQHLCLLRQVSTPVLAKALGGMYQVVEHLL